jgi:glycosyltransferase involved in cell wall biosynthesis
MRILLTNHVLAHRTGTELFLVELADRLRERGHEPVLYSPVLGALAREAQASGLEVIDDLDALDRVDRADRADRIETPFDLIHGQHWMETLSASLCFPDLPVVAMVHGHYPWQERVAALPTVRAWVTVNEATVDKVAREAGVPPERIEVVPNGVDLRRFLPRAPLPTRPARALVFSNLAQESSFLPAIRAACARFGIAVDVAGLASGAVASRPEDLLPAYDLVFAKGRAALEALAVGCAVVVCDADGSGPLVEFSNVDRLRAANLGRLAFDGEVTAERLAEQIARYEARAATALSKRLRPEIDFDLAVDRLESIYRRVTEEHRHTGPVEPRALLRAVVGEIRAIDRLLREREQLQGEVRHRQNEEEALRAAVRGKDAELARREVEVASLQAEIESVRHQAREANLLLRGRWWRLRERLLQYGWLRSVYRWVSSR